MRAGGELLRPEEWRCYGAALREGGTAARFAAAAAVLGGEVLSRNISGDGSALQQRLLSSCSGCLVVLSDHLFETRLKMPPDLRRGSKTCHISVLNTKKPLMMHWEFWASVCMKCRPAGSSEHATELTSCAVQEEVRFWRLLPATLASLLSNAAMRKPQRCPFSPGTCYPVVRNSATAMHIVHVITSRWVRS